MWETTFVFNSHIKEFIMTKLLNSDQAPLPWLVEAFKYDGLKEIVGPAHNKTILGWLTRLKAWWANDEVPWCLGPDTEVLTDKGFVRFYEFEPSNISTVAQLNTDTGHIEYVSDFEYIEKDYDGEVVINTKLGLLTDPNHRYYGKWSADGDYSLKPISELTDYGVSIPVVNDLEKGQVVLSYGATPETHIHTLPHNLETKLYSGKLYCLQVPTQVFIIRTETGVIIPTGNCGVFVAHCLSIAGRSIPKYWMRAKDYLNWGTELKSPAYGCIAVTSRKGGGHVFFVVGKTKSGKIVGFGGNQSNAVNLRAFDAKAIVGYRWPPTKDGVGSLPLPARFKLPVYSDNLTSVTSMS